MHLLLYIDILGCILREECYLDIGTTFPKMTLINTRGNHAHFQILGVLATFSLLKDYYQIFLLLKKLYWKRVLLPNFKSISNILQKNFNFKYSFGRSFVKNLIFTHMTNYHLLCALYVFILQWHLRCYQFSVLKDVIGWECDCMNVTLSCLLTLFHIWKNYQCTGTLKSGKVTVT